MKTINKYLSLFFVMTAFVGFSQEKNKGDEFTYEKIKVLNTEQGSLKLEGGNNAFSNKKITANKAVSFDDPSETPGQLSVSLTGTAIYNVPITVPVGINGIAPKIALSYNSQIGNGLAGYGWNISGISTISRIPSTKYHDGQIDDIDFDILDRFALDGQRLMLKSGVYGDNNTQYETENYSNLKIKSFGVSPLGAKYGPAYFIVYYPDGAIAHYGNSTDSRSRLNYAITYWQNPQGVRISYEYTRGSAANNAQSISKIKYGSLNTTTPINEITFEYKNRRRWEESYMGGEIIQRRNILSRIHVASNGVNFRAYTLDHDFIRLISVQESAGEALSNREPISFEYDHTQPELDFNDITTDITLGNIEQRNAETLALDFTGNGKMDFVVYPKTRDEFWLFSDIQNVTINAPSRVNTGAFEAIFPSKYLASGNKIIQQDALTIVKKIVNNRVNFSTYTSTPSTPIYRDHVKTWNAPTHTYYYDLDSSEEREIPQDYISGDFNGDGLTDVLAIGKPYNRRTCRPLPPRDCPDNPQLQKEKGESDADFALRQEHFKNKALDSNPPDFCYECNTTPVNNSQVHFINLKRNITSNFSNRAGQLNFPLSGDYKLKTGDFNGDGKTDLMHISNSNMRVYTIGNNNQLILMWAKSFPEIKNNNPLLFGDYNGDGKTDFITPTVDNSKAFKVFISTGKTFEVGSMNLPFRYKKTKWDGNNGVLKGYSLIPVDINGDGKTDIIEYLTTTYDSRTNGSQVIKIHGNYGMYSASPSDNYKYATHLRFLNEGGATKTGPLKHFPIPIFLSSNRTNKNLDFATISNNNITSLTFTDDHSENTLLRGITNKGVTFNIEYSSLDPEYTGSYPDVYKYANDEVYPNGSSRIALGTKVVTLLERISEGSPTLRQEYTYYDAVYNTEGLGFLGFKGVAKTNWHTGPSDRIFNISLFDHSKRGAITAEYSMENYYTFRLPTSNYISKTTYENTFSISSNKVYKLSRSSSLNQNTINSTFTNIVYQYDFYNNLKKTTTNYSGQATRVVDINYENNIGVNYYIGRPIKNIETVTIDGNTFKTEKELEYDDYLVSKIKHFGNNETAPNLETLSYDNFGNVIERIVKPQGSVSRTLQFQYDNTGRFLEKTIDAEGKQTVYDYNHNKGTVTEEVNHYGLKTQYDYDLWNRPTKVIDYLKKEVEAIYTAPSVNKNQIFSKASDGSEVVTIYDKLDRVETSKVKDVTGQWVATSYEYDKFDRIKRQSEPYIEGTSPSQWNETQYDLYGRPIKQTLHTGRIIDITYNGLSVTVDDGVKRVTTNADALGNTKSVTDPGGTINYEYYGSGNLKTANYNGVTVAMEEDSWGRKTKLTDPSAGVYDYEYNGFGELLKEKTPKGETNYSYSPQGKLIQKTITGDDTDMNVLYNYNPTSKLIDEIVMTSSDGNDMTYNYDYDKLYRLKETKETNPFSEFTKELSYDKFGRIATETNSAKLLANNKESSNTVQNNYQNGNLKSITDRFTGELIWSIDAVNARGQATKISMGNGLNEESTYSPLGYLEENKVINNGGFIPVEMMRLTTDFDPLRGTLKSRENSLFSWSETFGYDNLDRLITFNDNDGNNNHLYDDSGRITYSNTVGDYNYTGKSYKVDDIELNIQGDLYYQQNSLEQVSYNAFKKPVKIEERGKDVLHFKYNPFMGRAAMFSGSTDDDISAHTKSKHYASDGSIEINYEKETGKTTFVTYIGGDAYNASAIWRSEETETGDSTEDYYYLYRDYLGSIVMISDKNGSIKEKRHFDAWGNIVKVADGDDNALEQLTFLDRGYTGHEHLQSVNLIQMNGRLYDPKLKRFLAPDNYIQDISNTQNFNRYGYVLNNPLMYTDPSGEMTQGPPNGGDVAGAGAGAGLIYIGFQAIKFLVQDVDWNSVGDWAEGALESIKSIFKKKDKAKKQQPIVNYENTEVITQDPLAGSNADTSTSFYSGGGTDNSGLGINTGPKHMLSQSTGNNYGPWYHRWGNSENALAAFSYNIANDAFQVIQTIDSADLIPSGGVNPLTGNRANLNIDGTPNYSPVEGFVNTITTLTPTTRGLNGLKSFAPKGIGHLNKINAAQFSKLFKGNLSRLAASTRGKLNKVFNTGVSYLNNQIGNGMALLHTLKLKGKEEEDQF